jgi:hypothetical protein
LTIAIFPKAETNKSYDKTKNGCIEYNVFHTLSIYVYPYLSNGSDFSFSQWNQPPYLRSSEA